MASSSSRKRRERTPSPSEGEGSSGSAPSDSHEVTERPALPLRDPWYSPSLFFPHVSHGEAPPSPHVWMFSSQVGFAGSAQVSLVPPRFLTLERFLIFRSDKEFERRFLFSLILFRERFRVGLYG